MNNKQYSNSSELKSIIASHVDKTAEDLRQRLRSEWKKQKRVEHKYRQYAQSSI